MAFGLLLGLGGAAAQPAADARLSLNGDWLESAGRVRMLSVVEGRPSKFRRPDPPTCRLDVLLDTVFRGAFVLTPIEGM